MRLIELDPHWFTFLGMSGGGDIRLGITFECPHCRTQRLGVHFLNPIDPANLLQRTTWVAGLPERSYWQREGETFDTLTLTPSIDTRKDGHWHGAIRDGNVLST